MQGKKSFTKSEADAIRELLKEKVRSDRSKQKTIRGKIRKKYGFYISDFTFSSSDTFTHYDFDRLIKNGNIKIIGEDILDKNPKNKSIQKTKQIFDHFIINTEELSKSNIDKLTWDMCQKLSDVILADGINILKNNRKYHFYNTFSREYGNYLISHSNNSYYIGETKNINERLKQHSREGTSTFYKNYLKKLGSEVELEIDNFDVQILETKIGRKEVEEFGIVNLPTKLNKFQKGKRKRFKDNSSPGIWKNIQESAEILIFEGETALSKVEVVNWYNADIPNNAGLYYIEHNIDGLIYIGESSNILNRYKTHSSTTYFSALRRHIGTDCLNFELKIKKGKKRYFSYIEDSEVNAYLKNCSIKGMEVNFGRFELEEYLIRKYKPLLNRKENN